MPGIIMVEPELVDPGGPACCARAGLAAKAAAARRARRVTRVFMAPVCGGPGVRPSPSARPIVLSLSAKPGTPIDARCLPEAFVRAKRTRRLPHDLSGASVGAVPAWATTSKV